MRRIALLTIVASLVAVSLPGQVTRDVWPGDKVRLSYPPFVRLEGWVVTVDTDSLLVELSKPGPLRGDTVSVAWSQVTYLDVLMRGADRGLCFRGRPGRACTGYFMTDFSISTQVGGTAASDAGWLASWDLGYMRSIGNRSAIGGGVFFAVDGDQLRTALRPRFRFWVTETLTADVAAGVILSGTDTGAERTAPGFSGEVTLGISDLVAATVQLELVRTRYNGNALNPPVNRTYTAWYFGGKLGSQAAAVGGSILTVAGFIVAAAVASSLGG